MEKIGFDVYRTQYEILNAFKGVHINSNMYVLYSHVELPNELITYH